MLYKGKDRNYTREDLEALAEINIFPSALGVFTVGDQMEPSEDPESVIRTLSLRAICRN